MKDCLTCKHSSSGYDEIPCIGCLNYSLFNEYEIKVKQMKRSPSLLKKYFIMWLKITKLLYQIFILERKCNQYPDMRLYRGKFGVKDMVNGWRLNLDEKQKELKELVR